MGAVYEATMRCNLHCEFCYVGDLLNLEGEWRQELSLEALSKAFPEQKDFQISLTGGEIFMRKDIMSVLDLFREKGYACRLSHDQRHDHHGRTRRSAGGARGEGVPEAHQRLGRRSRGAARRGPRPEGDVRADDRRACGGCRQAAKRKGAPLRVSINTTVAHESLDALDQMVDVAERARRRCDRPESLDVQHARRSGGDRRLIGATDPSVIATFVTPDPGSRRRDGEAEGRGAGGQVPGAQRALRLPPEGAQPADGQLLHARERSWRGAASIRSCTRACRSPARSSSARSFASKSAT